MGKRKQGILTVEEYQTQLEECVNNGFLPLPRRSGVLTKYTFEAYRSADNKLAKIALLHQLVYMISGLFLQKPKKTFDKILEDAGISKSFGYKLLTASLTPREW